VFEPNGAQVFLAQMSGAQLSGGSTVGAQLSVYQDKEHDDVTIVLHCLMVMIKRFQILSVFVIDITELQIDC
jgi:hypothetical protein